MASAPFKVQFLPGEQTILVDPRSLPFQRDGKPGSILDIALGAEIEIDHACGGVNACSTCHVIVERGFETCGESSEAEEDMLDNAPGVVEHSRLACQAVPDGSADVVVRIPGWNRNMVAEGH